MQVAHQALQDALKANGRKMGDKETFPISRDVVEVDVWRHEFQRRREADEINKQSVVKRFNRQRRDLQEHITPEKLMNTCGQLMDQTDRTSRTCP